MFPAPSRDRGLNVLHLPLQQPPALGYGNRGLSVVVPRSPGVFKAGGSLCYHHGGTNRLTLSPGQAAPIGLMLPAEVSARKLYLELRDAATDLVLHKSPDLPVDLIG